jgi:hypothetical protein
MPWIKSQSDLVAQAGNDDIEVLFKKDPDVGIVIFFTIKSENTDGIKVRHTLDFIYSDLVTNGVLTTTERQNMSSALLKVRDAALVELGYTFV